jgi:hypothetical protein
MKRMRRTFTVVIGTMLAAGLTITPALGDEAKTPIKASMVLSIVSQPAELSGRALDRSLLEPGPPPAGPPGAEVLPDGSVKYGNVTVTVRNPCPPGTLHYEPPPLPGRRAR